MNRHDENFKMLAKGVVSQGVEDYKKALKLKWALEHKMLQILLRKSLTRMKYLQLP